MPTLTLKNITFFKDLYIMKKKHKTSLMTFDSLMNTFV